MPVSKEGLERIKSANPLEQLVAERGVKLRKKGRVLVGLCPFHKEKTASFTITPEKGLFHCFGCDVAGDVIGFVTKQDKVSFRQAVEVLCGRAGLRTDDVMARPVRKPQRTPVEALTPPRAEASRSKAGDGDVGPSAPELLAKVVEHYHETFCEKAEAQQYLIRRGITDADILRALKVGYADGSLLKRVPGSGELHDQLRKLGVITSTGRELMSGCIVVPIPDPLTGAWTSLYGRGVTTKRHCYLPGPFRGVLNFQAARSSDEVVLTESVLDALSFHQAGIATAIPIWGTNGFTSDHLDLFKREGVRRVTLALDADDAGRRATDALKEKLSAAGMAVRVASFPPGTMDANELLVSCNGDAPDAFRRVLDDAEPKLAHVSVPAPAPVEAPNELSPPASSPLSEVAPSTSDGVTREGDHLVLRRGELVYRAQTYPILLGRFRATIHASRGAARHVDTIDLYASRSRTEFAKRTAAALDVEASAVEADLLALLAEGERVAAEQKAQGEGATTPPPMSSAERAEALALLRRPDLLDLVAADIDALGYVGEETNKRLLYLVAVSRMLPDPLSAIVLSQSGAGKSGLTEVIEHLTPPEDVVLLTRLTPQSLYYVAPGFLDKKLVIVEERYGSMEADYSIRVLQSRKKLIAAAPVKDPATGNMRTKVFTVEARAAFIEATTASSVNHENATRCFELAMDESADQTRRIHERQRLMKTEAGLRLREQAEAITRRHWNAQRLLEPAPVVIPFADLLTFPSGWMRTRRDHARFLNLIEVSAFVHQHQRQRQGGAIVASVADYAVAYALAAQVLTDTLSDLKRPLKEAYDIVRELAGKGDGTVCRRDVREALGIPDSTVRRWLTELVELEYLAAAELSRGGQGKSTRYRVVERDAQPTRVLGLLTPDELAGRLRAGR